jgi:fucose permease
MVYPNRTSRSSKRPGQGSLAAWTLGSGWIRPDRVTSPAGRHRSPVSNSARRPGVLLALSFVGFVSLGLPDGLLGVAWPSIRASFGLPLDALGPLLVATTSGYVLSSFASGRLLGRMSVGALLVLSCVATATSLSGYALAPSWWVMVGFGLLAGLGAGAIDAGLNTHVATHHGARTLNWLHACYGVGAASGPVLMASVLMMGIAWQRGYAWVAAGQGVLAACFAATLRLWPRPSATSAAAGPGAPAPRAATSSSTLRLPAAWLGIAAFFVYTGLEASAGAWAYSLLTEARGVGTMTAGTWVSVYWGGLGAGRVVFGFLVGSAPLHALLRASLLGIVLGAGLVAFDLGALATCLGLALLGLASGPIFPSLIATTPERLGELHTANGVGFQIAAAALGQSLLPAGVGVLASRMGLEVVGPVLLAAALVLFAVHEAIVRSVPGAAGRRATSPAGA